MAAMIAASAPCATSIGRWSQIQTAHICIIMAYLLREGNGEVRCILDQHRCGLFSRDQWLHWMTEAGFEASAVAFVHSEVPPGDCEIFVGRMPTNARSWRRR